MGCCMRLRISSVSWTRSGGTGSSYHDSFCGSSLRATRSASGTSKKLWQSTISSTSGPIASRIAATLAMPVSTAASIAAAGEVGGGKPSHGAAFTARNPSFTAADGSGRESFWRPRPRRAIHVRVHRQAVSKLSAKEAIGRHIERLTGQIP